MDPSSRPASDRGLRSPPTSSLRAAPKRPDSRRRHAAERARTAFQSLRPSRGSDRMPAFPNSASLRRLARPAGRRRATSSRGRSVLRNRLVWLIVVASLALLPSLVRGQERQRLSLEAGTPVTVYADRIENLERERLLLAEGQRPDRAGRRAPGGRPRRGQHRDRRGRRDRPRGPVRRARPADRRAHRVQPPHRAPASCTRPQAVGRAPLLLRREPHGAVRGQVLPDRRRRLHDLRGRDPRLVGPDGLGHRLPRRLDVGDQRVLLGLEDPAGPLHPLLRDEPAQGPPQRAPDADLREQQREGILRAGSRSTSCCRTARTSRCRRPTSRSAGSGSARPTATSGARARAASWTASTCTTRRSRRTTTRTAGWRASATRRSSRRGWSSRRTWRASATTTFLEEFGNTLDERSRQRLESNVSLTQRWEKWNFVGRLFFYEDLTTDAARSSCSASPSSGSTRSSSRSRGCPGSSSSWSPPTTTSCATSDPTASGSTSAPRLSYPLTPGGFFTVTPRVGFRETIYDTRVVGTKVDRGFLVEDTEKELDRPLPLRGGRGLRGAGVPRLRPRRSARHPEDPARDRAPRQLQLLERRRPGRPPPVGRHRPIVPAATPSPTP